MFVVALLAVLSLCTAHAAAPAKRLGASSSKMLEIRAAMDLPIEHLAIVPQETQNLRLEDTAGFLVGYYYEDSSVCAGNATFNGGILTNTCLLSVPSDSAEVPVKSYYYTCTATSYTKYVYASSNCNPNTLYNTTFTDATCSLDGTASQQFKCIPSLELEFNSAYVMTEYYDDSGCNYLYSYSGEINNHCYNTDTESYFYAYPTGYDYATSDCSGVPTASYPLDTDADTCMAQTDINDDDSLNTFYSYLTLTNTISATLNPLASDDDDELSGGAIAGITIGCVAFVAIVVGLLYYFLVVKAAAPMASAAAPAPATKL